MKQPGILPAPPRVAHYLSWQLNDKAGAPAALDALAQIPVGEQVVIGLGQPLLAALGVEIPGMRGFPALSGPGVAVPSTQAAIWAWLREDGPGAAFDRAMNLCGPLGAFTRLVEDIPAFFYREGRDLSGFEDGTENPKDEEAVEAAFVSGAGPGLDGSSFVAAQRWTHDLAAISAMTPAQRAHTIGRDRETNEELADAPDSAHVKRSAQEDYDPPAFMLRRSMPWGSMRANGLYFVAFGADLDRYERVMRRMCGLDDGIVDGLFQFSRPDSGGYYWCPPVEGGRLDLRAVGR